MLPTSPQPPRRARSNCVASLPTPTPTAPPLIVSPMLLALFDQEHLFAQLLRFRDRRCQSLVLSKCGVVSGRFCLWGCEVAPQFRTVR
jgi:hypothetical protein